MQKNKLFIAFSLVSILLVLLLILFAILSDMNKNRILEETLSEIHDAYANETEIPDEQVEDDGDEPTIIQEKPDSKKDEKILVFVIDDVGNNLSDLKAFLSFDGPLTFAIMPFRPFTEASVELIQSAGKEIILHQPMEAEGGANPGESPILKGFSREKIVETLDKNLNNVYGAVGMNNHMGSLITSDKESMKIILKYLKERKLFFLDSFTTPNSVVNEISIDLNLPYWKRNSMFLDNESDKSSIIEAIEVGMETAEKNGHAVMIGHAMTSELAEVLLELHPYFEEEGFTLKELSQLILGGQ